MKAEARSFDATVRETLKHYTNPGWLGNHSPLATPYFLGRYLDPIPQPDTPAGRGQALQQLIFQAAAALWPGELPQSRQGLLHAVEAERTETGSSGPRYTFLLLELRYLRHFFALRTPPTMASAMPDYLNVSESAFYRHLEQAVEALTETLLHLARPNLRLEQPLLNGTLIGRDDLFAAALEGLLAGQSASLSGIGGIGKTSLGAALVAAWPGPKAFWYTFRPGLNDELHTLLFSLGHFLFLSGCPLLWRQLLAANGRLDSAAQALGLISSDLAHQDTPFLFCFDEVDLLHTATSQPRHGAHKQLLELLDGLRQLATVLFIGQRALIDTDIHFALQPLAPADVAALLKQSGGRAAALDSGRVYQATLGNPRLVELYMALADADEEEVDYLLHRKPAVKPLFNRLWKRLSPDEKNLLGALAVFRSYAPLDAWQNESALEALQGRYLLHQDLNGGVSLLPFFRQLIYDELPEGHLNEYHREAAAIRSIRGQHTAAAYHLCRAGEIDAAVKLWFEVQDTEIAQGSAAAAHAVFSEIAQDQLQGRRSRQLRVIQNRLNLLYGRLEDVLTGMDSYSWHPDEEITATAYQQWGQAERLLGNLEASRRRYSDALAVLSRLSNEMVALHVTRGKSRLLEADITAAEKEILLAEHQIESYKAVVAIRRGQSRQAQEHLQQALTLAKSAGDPQREAQAHYLLMIAAGDRGELEAAHEHAAAAMAYYEHVGDRLNEEGLRAELAGIYLNVGRFSEVIEPAQRALRFFEQIRHAHWPGHICSNLAEAYFETGNLEKAEEYAWRAIGTENPAVQPYAHYTLAQLFNRKGDPAAAEHSFRTGLEIAAANQDQFIAAYLQRLYGKMLLDVGRSAEGRSALETALTLFNQQSLTHEVQTTQQLLLVSLPSE